MSYSLLNHQKIPDDIHLAMGRLTNQRQRGVNPEDLLDETEQDEYEAISNERRKNEFLSSRHLVKGLADKFGLLESGFKISKDPMGKPYGMAGEQHIFLSIAHCTQEVMCGLSEMRDLGVDLEPADRQVHEGLGKRIFHPKENDEITNLALIRVWTIKEALVKLQGRGLRTNLNELPLKRIDDVAFSARFNDEKSARICSFQYDEHWVAVAYFQE